MDHDKSNSKSKEHGFSTCVVPPYKNIYSMVKTTRIQSNCI